MNDSKQVLFSRNSVRKYVVHVTGFVRCILLIDSSSLFSVENEGN